METLLRASILEPLSKASFPMVLSAGLSAATRLNLPVAIWRLPYESTTHLLISLQPSRKYQRMPLDELGKGFVFAPFDLEHQKGLCLPADILLSFKEEKWQVNIDNQAPILLRKQWEAQFHQQLRTEDKATYHAIALPEASKNSYRDLVAQCIEAIQHKSFEKIVPAREVSFPLPEGFDVISTFLNLSQSYPSAFASLVSTPETGTWMGASPEILIAQESNIFSTTALAATQPYIESKELKDTAWTQKEIEEQAMVSRYIINCFKKIRLRDFTEKGPRTVKAGHLLHLKTTFEVDIEQTNFRELAAVMLELLHPTSAVAGMPKYAAKTFLEAHENLDRQFYSGFLGPVQMEGDSHLYVNLRCMQIDKTIARLYAGAGVTADSVPEQEFLETEMKFQTMLNILSAQS